MKFNLEVARFEKAVRRLAFKTDKNHVHRAKQAVQEA
jgi:hypothetical protein